MKKFLFSILSVLAVSAAIAQGTSTPVKKATDVISFTEVKHDFGKIKQNVPVTYNFAFKNIGKQPVIIESATASCGCTTPAWPKSPVMQTKADKITAGFNAATLGTFTKAIQVKVAGFDMPVELNITGEVLNPEDYAKYEATKKKNTK